MNIGFLSKVGWVWIFILSILFSLLSAYQLLGYSPDYFQYEYFFDNLGEWGAVDSRFEIGFVLFASFIKFLFDSLWSLYFFSSFISLSMKFWIISKLKDRYFWFSVYILWLLPLHEMTQIRISLAIGFAYLSVFILSYSGSKFKYLISLVLFFLAVTFQSSILVLLPFVLAWRYFSKWSWFVFFFILVVPAILINSLLPYLGVFNQLLTSYVENVSETYANPFSTRMALLVFLLVLGFIYRKNIPVERLPFFYIFTMGIGIFYGMINFPVFSQRLMEITIFSIFFWVSYLPRLQRYMAFGAISLFLVYYLYLIFYGDVFFQ